VTALERLGTLVIGLKTRPITDAEQSLLRRHVLDTVGALLAGSRTREGQALWQWHRPGTSGLACDLAAFCSLARLSELDDIHLASMTTPGGIVIPAALVIAGSLPTPAGGALAAAIAAGYEVMVRLGAAIDGPSVLYRGIWPTYFAAPSRTMTS
jgi:2-methylcitrate dehydratase PrpD